MTRTTKAVTLLVAGMAIYVGGHILLAQTREPKTDADLTYQLVENVEGRLYVTDWSLTMEDCADAMLTRPQSSCELER